MLFSALAAPSEAQTEAGRVLSAAPEGEEIAAWFSVSPLSDSLLVRMKRGGSYPGDCTVDRESLRYLRVLHYNYDGRVQTGEMVCNKSVADDLLEIFEALYKEKYRICRMVLIDEYGASDEKSMAANNTSCFCFRRIKGTSRLSKHSLGLAVDLNPLDNPCVKYDASGAIKSIEPDTPRARRNASRSPAGAHTITPSDKAYKLFLKYGFAWGGAWRGKKDYQHFQK